jgi:hypothetical protein
VLQQTNVKKTTQPSSSRSGVIKNPQAPTRACLPCRKRTARFATYGFAVHGPTCHLFYRWLDAAVVGTGCGLTSTSVVVSMPQGGHRHKHKCYLSVMWDA